MNHQKRLSIKGRWSIRAVVLLVIIYEFQSPRLLGEVRLASAAATALAAIFVISRMRTIIKHSSALVAPPLIFFTLYLIINCISFAWSYDPLNSLLHGATLFTFLLLATSYANVDSDEFAGEVVRVIVAIAVLSWVMVVLAKNVAVLPDIVWRLNGPMMHSQRLSLILSLAIICLTLLKVRSSAAIGRRAWAAYLAILVVTLVATQTRAFTFFCIVTVGYIIFWHVSILSRVALLSAFIASVSAVLFNWEKVLESISRDGSNTMTLSGRTVAWENGIAMIQESPLLGYGFASFNTDLTRDFFASGYIIPHAHNTWINAAFETGVIGAGLMTTFMLAVLVNRKFFRPSYSEALVLWVILSGLTGLILGGKINPSAAIVMIFIAQTSLQNRMKTRRPEMNSKGQDNEPGYESKAASGQSW